MELAPPPHKPETKITMLNLEPRLGTPKGQSDAPPGLPRKIDSSVPKAKSAPVEEVIPAERPKTNTAKAESTPKAPTPKASPPKNPPAVAKTPSSSNSKNKNPEPGPKTPKASNKSTATKTVSPPKPGQPVLKTKEKTSTAATSRKGKTTTSGSGSGTPSLRTAKTAQPDAGKINQALSQIDSQLEERDRQLAEPDGDPNVPSSPGGLGSPGGKVGPRDLGYAQYQSSVRSKIVRSWVKTNAGGESRKLLARLRVQINASGQVISTTFIKRSGDASFDNSALRAVERSSPFPPPPSGVKQEALRGGFVIDFAGRVL